MQNGLRAPGYPIASVGNALTLLSLLGERRQLRVSEAASAIGTARSTAHRLLAMLQYHGFAQRDEQTNAYTAGPALAQAGLAALERLDLRRLARPVLERLCDDVGETVHLVELQGAHVLFLDSVETSRGLRVGSRAGRLMLAHCTAGGKAILAMLDPAELDRLYPGGRLERMTAKSHATRSQLDAELDAVRRRGFATNVAESEEDVAALAVAIGPAPGAAHAAISISAPLTRMNRRRVAQMASAARQAAAQLRLPHAG